MAGLKDTHVKFLAFLVGFLLTFLSIIVGLQQFSIRSIAQAQAKAWAEMPHEFVLLERYQSDTGRIEKKMDKMDSKIDWIVKKMK